MEWIKDYYLFKKNLKDIDELNNYLSDSISDYNNKPHGKLHGFTPTEILNGIDPNKDKYKNYIAKARNEQFEMKVAALDAGK